MRADSTGVNSVNQIASRVCHCLSRCVWYTSLNSRSPRSDPRESLEGSRVTGSWYRCFWGSLGHIWPHLVKVLFHLTWLRSEYLGCSSGLWISYFLNVEPGLPRHQAPKSIRGGTEVSHRNSLKRINDLTARSTQPPIQDPKCTHLAQARHAGHLVLQLSSHGTGA